MRLACGPGPAKSVRPTATTAEALTRRSSSTRQRGSGGAQQRPELAGPDLSSRATVPDPAPEGPGREAAARRQREARGKPASALTVWARTGRGAPGSGQRRLWVPPSLQPLGLRGPMPPRLGPRRSRGPPPRAPRRGSLQCPPGEQPGSARTPRPGPGRSDGSGSRVARGLLSAACPRPAPCPRAAERSALRLWRQDTASTARLIRAPCAPPF